MKTEEKLAMLRDPKSHLHTKLLIDQLEVLLKDYEKKLFDQAQHRAENAQFLAPYGSDCSAVKEKLACLIPPNEAQVSTADGAEAKPRKTTIPEKEAWLKQQRAEDKELVTLIKKQNAATYIIEADKVAIEIALQKMQNVRTVIILKTAQLNFLAGNE